MTIAKKDSSVNEPSSLSSFLHGHGARYLDIENSTVSIFLDPEFAKSREVLLAKKDSWWRN